ncbi:NADH dehydrogenase, FAD-containing subunit [Georgenia satyanarayanai]|uniref:NADH dehydrogenase, FAD-containing subunit n=1 Tax=Georgenia satyanarayanai TaxID=860221 RepID=A0A2Y9ARQ9_9MICO|nr:FAD-dependent oxidoreductase [Georgenia satyanarayanai]PYF98312.1 NADH dehydrogenase FAD-containing subunit [Georgenia satyanarayanai]SSA45197.1 NADH dehydrogenase, FAD-containing subunit [Georgenia satyanarayanai]
MTDTTQVVVVGGGYAGVISANRLTTDPDFQVTLINPRPSFVERIRLHQRTVGTHEAVLDFAEVLAPTVRLTVDAVTRIDAGARTLELASGGRVLYDYLVYAVGSHSAPATVPGVREHAFPLSTLEEATALNAALDTAGPAAPVVVVGGGATGLETASELAEHGRPVSLVTATELGPYLHPSARRQVHKQLDRLGVSVLDGVAVTAVGPGSVHLADGRELPATVTVWTAGFGVPDLAARSGLSTDEVGRLLTDETLTSVDDERIVAAGDAAAPSGAPYRMCCAAALPLGVHAADTVLCRAAGRAPAPFSVPVTGQCLSLGRRSGVLQLARRDDTAIAAHVGGRLGAWFKKTITAGNVASLRMTARLPGLLGVVTTVQDPRRARLLADQSRAAAGTARAD